MSATQSRIGHLITTIQNDFLDVPRLGLTLGDASARYAIDKITCEALFNVLIDTGVLTRNRAGQYIRFFPPPHSAAA
jgi:hypothetical protein